jgi:dGTPase
MDPNRSNGRLYNVEAVNPFIDNFQEDVFRIIRSTSFRRLAHKTQVFINDVNKIDHYRSRLTHTLEASVISRTISNALCLSSSLTEAICLAHDMGHPPFGHAGEDVLNEILKPHGGFNHNYYALKLITKLEEKHLAYDGLNLTWETLEGIIKHNGPLIGEYSDKKPLPDFLVQYNEKHDLHLDKFSSLEAQTASVSDDIAYASHDLEDGLNEGLFSLESFLDEALTKAKFIDFKTLSKSPDKKRAVHELMFSITNFFIEDVINNSKTKIKELKIKTPEDATNHNAPIVYFSRDGEILLGQIKDFLKRNMYRSKKILEVRDGYKHLIRDVYEVLLNNPLLLPEEWRNKEYYLPVLIGDYIAGMTDNFIIKIHKKFI